MHTLIVQQLGRRDYLSALDLQVELRDKVHADSSTEYLLLVEHPPVITLGRRANKANVLLGEDELRRRGFEVHEATRGGDVTYHGPGQIVGYPIIDLNRHHLGLREYMRALEETLIRTVGEFGIEGSRIEGLTGVWTPKGKVAAIGVAIRSWVSYHGFALNVAPDLSHFLAITPCGIPDKPVTSMAKLLGRDISLDEVLPVVERHFREVFGFACPAPDCSPAPLWAGPHGKEGAPQGGRTTSRRRLPPWLTKRLPQGNAVESVRAMLAERGLHTVCQSAHCPNIWECFSRHTATFMILGDRCTRTCGFCAVAKGEPLPLDPDEPARVADAARKLGLKHVVITSVTRDDLADGGAAQFARAIAAVREGAGATVEVLTPDFAGNEDAIRTVVSARPEVYNHNIETVPSLYARVRPQADYARSLALLERVKRLDAGVFTKSGLMLGLGEAEGEVLATLADLRRAGCDLLTLGQYLSPSKAHLPVARFVPPEEFDELGRKARSMGFLGVASAPFVRSSHEAGALFAEASTARRNTIVTKRLS